MPAICPKCYTDLNQVTHRDVTVDLCPGCMGLWLDPGELAQIRGAREDIPSASNAVASAIHQEEISTYICPRCEGAFETFEYTPGSGLYIDRCQDCQGIWLDAGELKKIKSLTSMPSGLSIRSHTRDQARLNQLVQAESKRLKVDQQYQQSRGSSSAGVYFFQLLTGLPVEVHAPRERFPRITLGLIISCCLVFLYQLSEGSGTEGFYTTYGLVPAYIKEGHGFGGLFSSLFIHGGLLHLLGNMYFLWLFGDNVEDRFSRFGYLVFYLFCGVAAALIHVASTSGSHDYIPTVGASGAISGIMGAYLVLYPRNKMYQVIWFIQFRISAALYLLFWIGLQIFFSSLDPGSETGGVAWFAHIGGFAVGAIGIWLLRTFGLLKMSDNNS
jgi:membrane associated rhomboid family serine protease